MLPGSRAVLFTAHNANNTCDDANIEVFSLQTGQRKIVRRGGFSGRYLSTPDGSGRLIYLHQSTLFAAPFDLGRLELTGAATPLIEEVASSNNGGGDFAVSPTGTVVYLSGKGQQGLMTVFWADRSGKKQPLHAMPDVYSTPRFSPDGKRLVFGIATGQGSDLWVKDLDRDTPSRLSFLKGSNNWPVWTPDGKSIIFRACTGCVPMARVRRSA